MMSTRWPAHVKRTAVTAARLAGPPPAGRALVGAAEKRERRAREDLQVDQWRAVLDVPEVQLDALLPGQRGPAVDLRPAGDPRLHVETAALSRGVALDLVGERRARPDQAHVAANHVPQLRQLVDRQTAQ